MLKKIFLVLLLALVVIQFIHPKKNKAEGLQPNYIGNAYSIPDDVKSILAKACNDCHSNNTKYPWYAKIQPVHWWLENHVKEGKKGLNLDEYTSRNLRFQYHKMEDIIDQIKDEKNTDEMWTEKMTIEGALSKLNEKERNERMKSYRDEAEADSLENYIQRHQSSHRLLHNSSPCPMQCSSIAR